MTPYSLWDPWVFRALEAPPGVYVVSECGHLLDMTCIGYALVMGVLMFPSRVSDQLGEQQQQGPHGYFGQFAPLQRLPPPLLRLHSQPPVPPVAPTIGHDSAATIARIVEAVLDKRAEDRGRSRRSRSRSKTPSRRRHRSRSRSPGRRRRHRSRSRSRSDRGHRSSPGSRRNDRRQDDLNSVTSEQHSPGRSDSASHRPHDQGDVARSPVHEPPPAICSTQELEELRDRLCREWFNGPMNVSGAAYGEQAPMLYLYNCVFTDEVVEEEWRKRNLSATSLRPSTAPSAACGGPPRTPRDANLEQASLEVESEDEYRDSEATKVAKARTRQVLTTGLARIGTSAVKAAQDSKKRPMEKMRAAVAAWSAGLDEEPEEREGKLGFPIHPVVSSSRTAILEGLNLPGNLAKEAKLDSTRYDRVPEAVIPLPKPKWQFYCGEDPGFETSQPKQLDPLRVLDGKMPEKVVIKRADLLSVRNRLQKVGQFANVAAHGLQVLQKLCADHIPDGERSLAEDTVKMTKDALEGVCGLSAAGVVNHTIWERQLAMKHDSRYQLTDQLPELERARIRVRPIDSNDMLFGADRAALEETLRKAKKDFEDSNRVVVQPKKPSGQSFRGSSSRGRASYRTSSAARGNRSRGGAPGGGSSRPSKPSKRARSSRPGRSRGGRPDRT